MQKRHLSPLDAARLANVTDQTVRTWCEQVPGLAQRDQIGRWRIDAGQFVRLVEGRARSANLVAERVKSALLTGEGAR
jgi:hypothetical protein